MSKRSTRLFLALIFTLTGCETKTTPSKTNASAVTSGAVSESARKTSEGIPATEKTSQVTKTGHPPQPPPLLDEIKAEAPSRDPEKSNTNLGAAAAADRSGSMKRSRGRHVNRRPTGARTRPRPPTPEAQREGYNHLAENGFKRVADAPLSTFSIDVDTASYANIRRLLNQGKLPPKDAVRIEEMINYFSYAYEGPSGDDAFALNTEVGSAPWNPQHRVVRIGLKGKTISRGERPSSNLVFLLDVSGSMNRGPKLPLLKKAFKILVNQLDARDTVSIVVYAGASGVVLAPTSGDRKSDIMHAIQKLRAGGSTNGGAGITLAYKLAQENYIKGGTNRVILATDGDMNVGTSSQGELIRLIQEKAKSGVFLSVLGFGSGNLQDSTMEQIANKGNGNYAYIDSIAEARKVLGKEFGGTLITIAKDVKIQVEFNPAAVAGYRLIGYENRLLNNEDFNDDTKDAGELGAGHTVTALFEVIPAGLKVPSATVDALKYQKSKPAQSGTFNGELLTVKLRYKKPDGDVSTLITRSVAADADPGSALSNDFRFATAVAGFGMLLRDSKHKGNVAFQNVIEWATSSVGKDPSGSRMEMIVLIKRARELRQSAKR